MQVPGKVIKLQCFPFSFGHGAGRMWFPLKMRPEKMLQLRFKYQMCAYNGILFSLKKEGILTYATTQINLEDMINEISWSQKDKYCTIPRT